MSGSTAYRSINDGSLPWFTINNRKRQILAATLAASRAQAEGRMTWLARSICDTSCSLIDRGLAHYVGFVLAKDSSMKHYIVEFAQPSGPLSLIAASVRAASKSSAIRIVHGRLRKIVSEQALPIVTEYSVEIDEAAASLCRAFRTVTDNDHEKLAVVISALEQYSPILATRIRGLLNRDADGSAE